MTVTIIQGRYDVVCPPQTAWDLHKALPHSRLFWIPDAGHSAKVREDLVNSIGVTTNPFPGARHPEEVD